MSINSSTSTTNKRKKNPSTTTHLLLQLHPAPPRTERISCQRCRTRKIKCNYELPCFNCKRDGSQCIQPIDMRSKRLKATSYNITKKLDLMIKFINDCKIT